MRGIKLFRDSYSVKRPVAQKHGASHVADVGESPEAAVLRVSAVVAEHEIFSFRDFERDLRKYIARSHCEFVGTLHVFFLRRDSVYVYDAFFDVYDVAGDGYDSLHEIALRVNRITEHVKASS